MNEPRIASNVYYLPVPAAVAAATIPPAPTWRDVATHTLWRLRFALAEIRHAFRAPVPSVVTGDHPFLAQSARLITRPEPRPASPARVLDFESFAARAASRRSS